MWDTLSQQETGAQVHRRGHLVAGLARTCRKVGDEKRAGIFPAEMPAQSRCQQRLDTRILLMAGGLKSSSCWFTDRTEQLHHSAPPRAWLFLPVPADACQQQGLQRFYICPTLCPTLMRLAQRAGETKICSRVAAFKVVRFGSREPGAGARMEQGLKDEWRHACMRCPRGQRYRARGDPHAEARSGAARLRPSLSHAAAHVQRSCPGKDSRAAFSLPQHFHVQRAAAARQSEKLSVS